MSPEPPILVSPVNISEGRRREVVAAIAGAAEGSGVAVLDIHTDPDHHRSVLTFAGPAPNLLDGLIRAARAAVEAIDLRQHAGVHPRLGALDVVPFVGLDPAGRAAAPEAARRFAAAAANELGVPCFFYESACEAYPPRSLPEVRRRAFRDLAPDRAPPGLTGPHPSAGAIAVGARDLLVAFNVDLATDDIAAVRGIAAAVRERDGGLAGVRALGLRLPSRGATQISMNLVQPLTTGVGAAYAAVSAEARARGIAVLGSELVGLAPEAAMPADWDPLRLVRPARILEEELARYFVRAPGGGWTLPPGGATPLD